MTELTELQNPVLALPLEQRIELANALWDSRSKDEPEYDAETKAMLQKRLEELGEGAMEGIPNDVVFAENRRHFMSLM